MKLLSKLSFVLVLTFCFSCKKSDSNLFNAKHDEYSANKEFVLLKQKYFSVQNKDVLKVVKRFIDGVNGSSNHTNKLIEADSVGLDSSLFVLEAALNFSFDVLPSSEDTLYQVLPSDTTDYTIAIARSTLNVHSDDLEDAYIQLTQFISNQLDDTIKVKIVDIEAFVTANQVIYRAIIVKHYATDVLYYCGAYTQNSYASFTAGNPQLTTSILTYYMSHCDFPMAGCPGAFYTNVASTVFSNMLNTYPTSTLHWYNVGGGSDNTVVSPAQLVTYRSNLGTLIQNYANGLSVNHTIGYLYVWDMWGNVNGSYRTWWGINVTCGVLVSPC